jgi:hypothetical protein
MGTLVNQNMTIHKVGLGPVWEHLYAAQPVDAPIKVTEIIPEIHIPKPLMKISRDLKIKHVDILKIDIEGSEYSAIPQFLKEPGFKKLGVSMIATELHYFGEVRLVLM